MDTAIGVQWHDVLGLLGFALYMIPYLLLQINKIDGNSLSYVLMNLIAAILVLATLTVEFNLASALIQITWILISVIGLCLRKYTGNEALATCS